MNTSLDDARYFNDKIQQIVRGPQQGHDLNVIRRYFRAYLYCWKTVLHFVREAKGLRTDSAWKTWCDRWQTKHLDANGAAAMKQLRETRDYDTHSGTLVIDGEIAAGLFPLVFVDPVDPAHLRRELVTITQQGLEVITGLIATHAAFH